MTQPLHIHVLGICGTFMGGLAVLAKAQGHTVTGCDAQVYPPMSEQLQAQGITLIEGFSAEQLTLKPDVYVIGNVVTRGNPLMEAILNQGLPYVSGPQWLAENILRDKWVLAVAGTHGKTTTSAMLAWILEFAKLAPSFLIGGVPNNFACSACLNDASSFFVIEADEYDTAFFDKRSKFIHYRPRTLILNNLEFDHADIFMDLAAIETQFHHLIRTVPQQGLIISNGQSESLKRVLDRGCWSEQVAFSEAESWRIETLDKGDSFIVYHAQTELGRVTWDFLGEHNRLNALASIIAAQHVGVPVSVSTAALAQFTGVKRRMEVCGVVRGITVYDDFAHHPTAIKTTLEGLRNKVGSARIIAVLEPRSNTMKLGVMRSVLPASLHEADKVLGYSGRLSWDLAQALAPLSDKAAVFQDTQDLVAAVAKFAQSGDHVVVMSNGGFDNVHQRILTALAI